MAATSEKDVEKLKTEFAELKSDVSKLTETVRDISGDGLEQGRDRIRRRAQRSREQAREAVDTVESEIGERPLTSVAAAFGVGFVLGKLLDR